MNNNIYLDGEQMLSNFYSANDLAMQSATKKQPFTDQEMSIMNKMKKKNSNVFDGAHKLFKKSSDYMDNNDVLGNLS
jgi:hypothetical protein